MRRAVALLAGLVPAPLAAQNAPPDAPIEAPVLEAFVDGEIRALNIRVDAGLMRGAPPVLWTDEISHQGADYIRLLLRVEGSGFASGAFVRLVSPLGQEVDIPLADIGPDGYWSDLMPLGRVRMALVADAVPDTAALILDSLAVQTAKGTLYSTWGENEILPVHAPQVPEAIRARAAPVAFVSFVQDGFARTCTGFLVAPDMLVTNEHCINDAQTCASMTAVFGYEFDDDNRLAMGPQLRCAAYDEAFTAYDLDVSAVRLDRSPGPEYPPVDMAGAAAPVAGPLYIIQHPGSQPKQVSFINCAAVRLNVDGRAPGSDFTHTCDTAGGSSGAPVFNAQGRLVGVHHFGFMEDKDGLWSENRSVHGDRIGAWWSACCAPPQDPD